MATPGMGYFVRTGDDAIDVSTHGYYWQLGPDRTIDWAIAGGRNGEFWYDPAGLATEVSQVFSTISYFANIRFNYVGSFVRPEYAYTAGSELTVSLSASTALFPSSSIWAKGFFPDPRYSAYAGQPGDIYLNVNSQANHLASYAPGSAGWALMLHEALHTLGLKHPHDDGGTGRPTMDQIGLPAFDTDWITVMSYDDTYDWNNLAWDPITPMLLDVIALQYLYGKNMTTNAGDTSLALQRIPGYGTLWDASGTDTVTAAGSSEGWLISLPSAQLSALVDTKAGLAVPVSDLYLPAPTSLIWLAGDMENATGSSFADRLQGSDGDNRLTGGFGNDYIDGSGGIDTAIFAGTSNQYTITRGADGVTVAGYDGADLLVNVERLVIGSTKVAIDIEGHGGQAYRLYQAAFNRTPDMSGLGYQINALDIGLTITQVAGNFIASPEFQRTYGLLDNTAFVTQLYSNVLHRAPDAGGLAYHLDRLAHGAIRADILVGFSESPENQANVIGSIEHGMVYA